MPVNGGDEGLGRGGVAEESEAAEVESGEFEKPPIRVAKDPGAPTEQEVQEHYATHLPYRSWCPVCVKARGTEEPRKKATTSNDKPIVSMDCKELGEEIEDDKIEMIVIKDEKTGCVSAHHCERKGATDTWAMDRVIDDIETFGHNDVILKTDGEPSMLQVQRHVKAKRAGTTIPMNPPAYNPQSNGAAERAVQEVTCQIRALKIGLQERIKAKVGTNWAIMQWMIELAPVLINRCLVGKDGRTPYRRLMGKDSAKGIVELGERVLAKIARGRQSGRKQSLKTRWEDAVWVGIAKRSNEHIVVLEGGGPAMRCRTIKRRPQDCRWEANKVSEMKATPRHPNPKDEQDGDIKAKLDVKVEVKEIVPELRLPKPETAEPREAKRRNFRITKKLLEKYGYSAGCPGCEAALDGRRAREHSDLCRSRLEESMELDPEDENRIRSRDQRAYGGGDPERESPPAPTAEASSGSAAAAPDEERDQPGDDQDRDQLRAAVTCFTAMCRPRRKEQQQ